MKKAALALAATVALSSCVTIDPITPGPNGLDAIEFTQATTVRDHAFNTYIFPAGRRFIADRRHRDGRTLYCGMLTVNDDPRPFETCIGFEAPSTLILGLGVPPKEVRRPQTPGVIRMLKTASEALG